MRILALLGALMLAPAVYAQSFEELLPETTLGYVSIDNLARTKERFEASALNALWSDAAVQAFLEKPLKKWADWMEETKKDDGITPEEVFNVVAGQVVFAITHVEAQEGGGENVHLVLLADVGENADKVRELSRSGERARLEDGKARREEEEFRGVTIVKYVPEDEEQAKKDTDCWFLDGSLFALAEDVEDLKRVLARRGNPEGSLATRETHRKMRARLGERADLSVYVDGRNLIEMLKKSMLDEDEMVIAAALGLTSVDAFGLRFSLEPGGMSIHARMTIAGEKEGLLKLFDGKNTTMTLPRFVPADAVAAATFALDMSQVLPEVRKTIGKIDKTMVADMDAGLEMLKGMTGVDLQNDLLGALGEEIAYYMKFDEGAPPPGAMGPGGAPSLPHLVVALQVKDRQRLETALNMMLVMAGPMIQEQDYLGMKMRTVRLPVPGVTPAFALLPDQLVFSLHVEDLKEVIGRYGKDVKGLVDSDDFKRALQGVPAERFSFGFSREARSFRQGFLLGLLAGGVGPNLDIDKFPSVEVLEKYLDAATAVMVNEEGGVYYRYFLRFKEQKK